MSLTSGKQGHRLPSSKSFKLVAHRFAQPASPTSMGTQHGPTHPHAGHGALSLFVLPTMTWQPLCLVLGTCPSGTARAEFPTHLVGATEMEG